MGLFIAGIVLGLILGFILGTVCKNVGQMSTLKDEWEVVDSYNVPVFTGSLVACGTWIDPVLGIVFDADHNPYWPGMDDIDEDRITRNADGSFTVKMYEGGGGIGGELTVRKVTDES